MNDEREDQEIRQALVRDKFTTDIVYCPRCRHDHPRLEFTKFSYPVKLVSTDYPYWASCPENGEPIVLRAPAENLR